MSNWKDKRVLVIGAARQGLAMGRYLASRGARVVMNDQKPAEQMDSAQKALNDLSPRIEWIFGSHPLTLLDGTDCICVSGGVSPELPLLQEARRRSIPITNDSQVFLEDCKCRTVGITGSAGKTTTTSLVGKIAETHIALQGKNSNYRKVWVGGNIGAPLLAVVDEVQSNDLAVMELSSFQLELMNRSVDIACVLNITPNHLDRHASMEDYFAAKKRIIDFQSSHGIAVLSSDDRGAWSLSNSVKGQLVTFGKNQPPAGMPGAFIDNGWVSLWNGRNPIHLLKQSEILLRGWHNVENVLASCAICQALGISIQAMQEAIRNFRGVPHRLEWVITFKGADWYNDSIATAPERVIAAIQSFDSHIDQQRPIVLLAGGRDKNLPWDELAELIHARVDHLILFGESAEKVAQAVGPALPNERPYTVDSFDGLEQAVLLAGKVVEPGDIVLLSPGGTSFDEFRDFEERGEAFKRWVHNLLCM